ncbi:MAG: hypothetical protein K2Q07_01705 [Burkholderiaceae bacterium]|nr:hypothetical protein [Burkholderiaceae bacterium]
MKQKQCNFATLASPVSIRAIKQMNPISGSVESAGARRIRVAMNLGK